MTTMTQLPASEESTSHATSGGQETQGSQGSRKGSLKDRLLENPWAQEVKKILLAGVGAVVLAQEEIEEFVKRLVAKGEIGVKEARKIVDETLKRRREGARKGFDRIEKSLDLRIERILARMHVATKKDIRSLQDSLSSLVEKLERLAEPTR